MTTLEATQYTMALDAIMKAVRQTATGQGLVPSQQIAAMDLYEFIESILPIEKTTLRCELGKLEGLTTKTTFSGLAMMIVKAKRTGIQY